MYTHLIFIKEVQPYTVYKSMVVQCRNRVPIQKTTQLSYLTTMLSLTFSFKLPQEVSRMTCMLRSVPKLKISHNVSHLDDNPPLKDSHSKYQYTHNKSMKQCFIISACLTNLGWGIFKTGKSPWSLMKASFGIRREDTLWFLTPSFKIFDKRSTASTLSSPLPLTAARSWTQSWDESGRKLNSSGWQSGEHTFNLVANWYLA